MDSEFILFVRMFETSLTETGEDPTNNCMRLSGSGSKTMDFFFFLLLIVNAYGFSLVFSQLSLSQVLHRFCSLKRLEGESFPSSAPKHHQASLGSPTTTASAQDQPQQLQAVTRLFITLLRARFVTAFGFTQ